MRCFVALVPPRALTDGIATWGAEAFASFGSVRLIDAASMHLTLAFLGKLGDDEVERAGAAVSAVRPRRVRIRLEPAVVGVPRRRPRVLALQEGAGETGSLRAELAGELTEAGLLEPDERAFWSHLSVARVRRGALDGGRGRAAIEALPSPPGRVLEPHDAERLVLFRSELGPERATYTSLAQTPLFGGGR